MCCDQKDLAEVMLHQFWPRTQKTLAASPLSPSFSLFLPPMHVPLLSLSLSLPLSPDAIVRVSLN